jgi:hypothetical protein
MTKNSLWLENSLLPPPPSGEERRGNFIEKGKNINNEESAQKKMKLLKFKLSAVDPAPKISSLKRILPITVEYYVHLHL